MSERIEKLRCSLDVEKYPVCTEKARLYTESYQTTEGEPIVIRRAKGFAHVLDNITIFIEDGELIVGNTATKPMGFEVVPEATRWTEEDLERLSQIGFQITEDDKAEIKVLDDYWNTRSWRKRLVDMLDDERLWPFYQSGVHLPAWKEKDFCGTIAASLSSGMGLGWLYTMTLFGFDFGKVIDRGLNSVIQEAERELKNIRFMNADATKKAYFLRAAIIGHQAIIRFAERFAALAEKMSIAERDPKRKKELERIAEICRWVPANPARTFYEAMQSFWLIFLTTVTQVIGPGRLDQYMYLYYKKDIETGIANDEEVLELLQCLRIKDMQINYIGNIGHQEKQSGMPKWHNVIIGGVTPEGKDASNPLSYLILEAAKRCPTPHHTITLRVHDGTPEDLMRKALEVVRTGIGLPAFAGDKSYIEYFVNNGASLEDARNYYLGGCFDGQLSEGKSRTAPCHPFNVPLVFDMFLHGGYSRLLDRHLGPETKDITSYKTFNELMDGFEQYLTYFMELAAENDNLEIMTIAEVLPDPIHSSLMYEGIKEGKDYFERSFPFDNVASLNPSGMITVADSMTAIRKLVFDEKKTDMKELMAALDSNWEGEQYQEIRKMCRTVPKFGNDDDYADQIAKNLYQFWADKTVTFDTPTGGKHVPSGISISAHGPGGALTGATPDGRYAGEYFADGSLSAAQGKDTHGPTAMLKSAMKIDQSKFQSTLLNMKFNPSAIRNEEDLNKMSALIKSYFSMGGKHVQFNIVDKAALIDAQAQPEKHGDLLVRVAGYSTHFVKLSNAIQEEIKERMEHQKVL